MARDVRRQLARLPAGASHLVVSVGWNNALEKSVLLEEPVFPGCVVPARLLGLFEAEQTEKGKTVCIDRLVAVAVDSPAHCDFQNLGDLNERRLDDIEHFFISYNDPKGKKFKPLGRFGPEGARTLTERGRAAPADSLGG